MHEFFTGRVIFAIHDACDAKYHLDNSAIPRSCPYGHCPLFLLLLLYFLLLLSNLLTFFAMCFQALNYLANFYSYSLALLWFHIYWFFFRQLQRDQSILVLPCQHLHQRQWSISPQLHCYYFLTLSYLKVPKLIPHTVWASLCNHLVNPTSHAALLLSQSHQLLKSGLLHYLMKFNL